MRSESFVAALQALPDLPNVFNPWKDYDRQFDVGPEAPGIRAHNLRQYLSARESRTKLLFVGEAPGYQGCHFSGIAMTSERILLGNKSGIDPSMVFEGRKERSSKESVHPRGANEPTASIVWSLMAELGVPPYEFIFWNSLPTHPHKPGQMLTNRAPKPAELAATAHLLPLMIELAGTPRLIAVGRVAQKTLAGLGHQADWVRHPAMGGAPEFRQQVRTLL